jgi:hypothetical protein
VIEGTDAQRAILLDHLLGEVAYLRFEIVLATAICLDCGVRGDQLVTLAAEHCTEVVEIVLR